MLSKSHGIWSSQTIWDLEGSYFLVKRGQLTGVWGLDDFFCWEEKHVGLEEGGGMYPVLLQYTTDLPPCNCSVDVYIIFTPVTVWSNLQLYLLIFAHCNCKVN